MKYIFPLLLLVFVAGCSSQVTPGKEQAGSEKGSVEQISDDVSQEPTADAGPPESKEEIPLPEEPAGKEIDSTEKTTQEVSPAEKGSAEACDERAKKIQALMDKKRTSPNAILIIRDQLCGTKVHLSGDPKNATKDTLWRIGSVTKTYVAAAIMLFVRKKLLSLEDPVSKWFPEYEKLKGVTVRMLLDHTSGLYNYTTSSLFWADMSKSWTPKGLVDIGMKHKVYFAPGKGWQYSNTNYILLGMLLEKLGKEKIAMIFREQLLKPVQLKATFLEGAEKVVGTLTKGFNKAGKESNGSYSMTGPWAAGAMVSTGADLCNWVAELYGGNRLLNEEEKKLMIGGAVKVGNYTHYGLGTLVLGPEITAGAGQGMGHNGGIGGFSTQAYWFPKQKTAICSVVNQDGASANDLTLIALQVLFGR